jgi:hypothetical protein
MVRPEIMEVQMKNCILMTMLMISSVAINAMDVPNGRAVYMPMSEDEALKLALALSVAENSNVRPLNEDQALKMVLALSEAEERERAHKTEKDKQIEAKEMELAIALSGQEASKQANNAPAQPDQHDLTNPILVLAWAKKQGIIMTTNEACAFADEQRDQLAIQQAIDFSRQLDDAPKAPAKPDNTPQALAKVDSDSEEAKVDECPVCMENLDANVVPVGPNCIHKIHSACLAAIKTKFTECPECRAKI